jgi:hypothetical protein
MKLWLGSLVCGSLLALGLGCNDYDTYRGVPYGRPRGEKATTNTPRRTTREEQAESANAPAPGPGAMPGSAAIPKKDPLSKVGPPPPATNKGAEGNSGPQGSRNRGEYR